MILKLGPLSSLGTEACFIKSGGKDGTVVKEMIVYFRKSDGANISCSRMGSAVKK